MCEVRIYFVFKEFKIVINTCLKFNTAGHAQYFVYAIEFPPACVACTHVTVHTIHNGL